MCVCVWVRVYMCARVLGYVVSVFFVVSWDCVNMRKFHHLQHASDVMHQVTNVNQLVSKNRSRTDQPPHWLCGKHTHVIAVSAL